MQLRATLAATDGPSDAAWYGELELMLQEGRLLEVALELMQQQGTPACEETGMDIEIAKSGEVLGRVLHIPSRAHCSQLAIVSSHESCEQTWHESGHVARTASPLGPVHSPSLAQLGQSVRRS